MAFFKLGAQALEKSTLFKIDHVDGKAYARSKLFIHGTKILEKTARRQITVCKDARLALFFQNHQLLFDRSVFLRMWLLPLLIAGHPVSEIQRRVRAALDKVGLLSKEKLSPIVSVGGRAAAYWYRTCYCQQTPYTTCG